MVDLEFWICWESHLLREHRSRLVGVVDVTWWWATA
jgi:hypothetical protein